MRSNEIKWALAWGFNRSQLRDSSIIPIYNHFFVTQEVQGTEGGWFWSLLRETLSSKNCVSDASEEGQRTSRTSSIDPFNLMVVELLKLQRSFNQFLTWRKMVNLLHVFFQGERERDIYRSFVCKMFGRHLRSAHEQFTIRKGKVVFSASFPRWNYAYAGKTKSLCHERPWQVPWASVGSAEISVPPWCFGGKCVLDVFWQVTAVLAVADGSCQLILWDLARYL